MPRIFPGIWFISAVLDVDDSFIHIYPQDKLAQVGVDGNFGQGVSALLVETRANSLDHLAERIKHGIYPSSQLMNH